MVRTADTAPAEPFRIGGRHIRPVLVAGPGRDSRLRYGAQNFGRPRITFEQLAAFIASLEDNDAA